MSNVDVYIIQKKSTLERYTKQSFDFNSYLERDHQSKESLLTAHTKHENTRAILLACLAKLSLNYKIFNLDELKQNNISFYSEKVPGSGLQPRKKLIISLGGDGTLLHASHYAGGDIELLGINSCPQYSVGHLCSVKPEGIETALQSFLQNSHTTKSVRRLKIEVIKNGTKHEEPPLALNDVLLCNKHPAATSRYQIAICSYGDSKQNRFYEVESEKQLSSGIWVSSPAGSTAAISPYGFPQTELTSKNILVAVREPYTPHNELLKLKQFILDGDAQFLSFFSRMRQGLVCVDGPDFCITLGFGDTVKMSLPTECSLKLFT